MAGMMSFAQWKEAILADGWFTGAEPYLKAVRIVFNAYVSHEMGQLSAKGLKRAVEWAYRVDRNGAYFEEQRNETKKASTAV